MSRWLASLLLLGLGCAFAQEENSADASYSLFVFDAASTPMEQVEIRRGDQSIGSTNQYGALFFALAPGEHELSLHRDGHNLLQLPVTPVAGEITQIIINVIEGGAPRVAIESSNSASEAAASAIEQANAPPPPDPGTIRGIVTGSEDGLPVANATVFVAGTALRIVTDELGRFEAEVPAGNRSISVMHDDFATIIVDNIPVVSDQTVEVPVEVVPAGLELPDFVVLEPYIEGSLADVMDEQRTSAGVTNVLGAEQISRAGDSDAAGALKRITGLTLVDGQFIYVRGLGERYATTSLNGATVPSPDPTRRVVPLDLFPASIIRSVLVAKSYSAEIPAGFGGGAVGIRTKAIPDAPFFEISAGLGWNSQTTFKDGLTYPGGSDDWTGFDDGTRDLPMALGEALISGRPLQEANVFAPEGFTAEELEAFGESLSDVYSVSSEDVRPDGGLGISGGYRWDFDRGVAVGILGAIDYGDSYSSREEIRRDYRRSATSESGLDLFNDFEVENTEREVELSGFLTTGLRLGENHNIDTTFTYLRLTRDQTQIREGFLRDQGGDVRFTSLLWEERELFSKQVFGRSLFPALNDLQVEWSFDDSAATRIAPDQRAYRQDFDEDRDAFALSLRPGALERQFDALTDDSRNYGVDLQIPWDPASWLQLVFTGGYNSFSRQRDSQIFRLSFRDRGRLVGFDELFLPSLEELFSPELIASDGWVIENRTRATDNYQALQDIDAMYLALNVTLFQDFKLYLGARDEQSMQQALTFDPFAAELEPVVADLTTDDLYPAATLTWEYSDSSQIRFAYAETVSRPDLRELSEAPFRDPVLDLIVIGNPDLVQTDIEHIDVRWERYFSPVESISVAYFRKKFANPIERIVSTGAAQIGTFANALSAVNEGYEIDVYKTLGFIWEPLDAVYISANAAYISSSIALDPFTAGNLTSQERPLQGQSDVVANVQIGYDNPELGMKMTLLFNHTGQRITDVGTEGLPDIIEQPFNQVDFVYSQTFDPGWSLKLKLGNLLDDQVEFLQSTEIKRSYKKGRSASLSVEKSL